MKIEIEEFKQYLAEEHNLRYQWVETALAEQTELFLKRTFYLCDHTKAAKYVCIFNFYKHEIDRDVSFKKVNGFIYFMNKEKRFTATVYQYLPNDKSLLRKDFKQVLEPARK